MGVNTALRISDLLQLQIGQFLDDRRRYKHRFWIHEQKRNKRHEVTINQSFREALTEYMDAYLDVAENSENFVFFNTKTNSFSEPIKPGQTWKFIVSICHEVRLPGNFGTHSLSKTWGFHAGMQGIDLALIMHKLNHESIAYTKRYLGITDDKLQAVASGVVGVKLGDEAVGLHTQPQRFRIAQQRAVFERLRLRPAAALAAQCLAQRQVVLEQIVIFESRRLVEDLLRRFVRKNGKTNQCDILKSRYEQLLRKR